MCQAGSPELRAGPGGGETGTGGVAARPRPGLQALSPGAPGEGAPSPLQETTVAPTKARLPPTGCTGGDDPAACRLQEVYVSC